MTAVGLLPMHGVGLVPTVSDVVKQAAHARILSTFLSSAEVVIHDFVYNVVRNSTSSVWNPDKEETNMLWEPFSVYLNSGQSAFHSNIDRAVFHSPDDKINVVIGDGNNHIRHVVRGAQVALHGGPDRTKNKGENVCRQKIVLWKQDETV